MTAETQTAAAPADSKTAKAAPTAPAPKIRKFEPLIGHMPIAYDRRPAFILEVPTGTVLEDVLEPGFWKNVYKEFHRGGGKYAKIEVICADQSWEAELRCYAVGDGFAKMRVLNSWEAKRAQGRPLKLPDGWEAEPNGSHWRVRNSEGEIVVDKQPSEWDAVAEARKLHKAMS